MSVLLTSDIYIGGVLTTKGTTVSLGYALEQNLVYQGSGTWVSISTLPIPPVSAPQRTWLLAQSGVAIGLAPSGTVATNGTITLGTALPRVYSGGIWLRLPTGAVVAGAAGLYWCVMSTTTIGQVYTNFVDTSLGFVSYIPTGTLVTAVGSNGAYTPTTSVDIVLGNVTLPANSLGNNGGLRVRTLSVNSVNANTKTVKHLLSGVSFLAIGSSSTSSMLNALNNIVNQGVPNAQQSQSWGVTLGNSTATSIQALVDTTLNQPVTITSSIAVATDFIVFESFTIEVLPS